VLTRTQDNEELIERVAALDIGKAELMCRVRVPGEVAGQCEGREPPAGAAEVRPAGRGLAVQGR